MKIVEDSRLIASETSCPGTTISNNYQEKNSLLPSVVKLFEWNTEAAIFSDEGCLEIECIAQ